MDNGGIWPGDESYFQNIRETALQDTIEQLTKELAETQALVERKDALIKQMRRAMERVVANFRVNLGDLTEFENKQIEMLEAALEAAERE